MIKSICLYISFLLFFTSSRAQSSNEIFVKEFNWSLRLPTNFSTEDLENWKAMQQKGQNALEKTVGHEVTTKVKTLFVFKDNRRNFFEATAEPYDLVKEGDYIATCERMNDLLYKTFQSQMPSAFIDTVKGVQFIDSLEFQKLATTITYADNTKRYTLIYRRLFDNNEITISLMYEDDKVGRLMEAALLSSKFGKK